MEKINSLSLKLETYSDVDLNKCGVYKYAQSSAFEILLFGVSVNGGEVQVYDLAQGESVPVEIIKALTDNSVLKWSFNASFERVCLSVWLHAIRSILKATAFMRIQSEITLTLQHGDAR